MATHSSTLAWKIPWMEEPGRLQSMGSQRVWHDWVTSLSLFTFMDWRRKWQPTLEFLPGESQGWGSLVGCRLWDRTVGHDWSDLAAAAVANSYLTLCDPMHCSLPGSSVHGILPARVFKLVAIFFSQRIFPIQGSNPHLPLGSWILNSELHGNPKSLKKHNYGSKENWCREIWLNFNYVNFILNGNLLPWFLKLFSKNTV